MVPWVWTRPIPYDARAEVKVLNPRSQGLLNRRQSASGHTRVWKNFDYIEQFGWALSGQDALTAAAQRSRLRAMATKAARRHCSDYDL